MRQKIIPVLIVLAGFLLLSYPFMSNYLFERSAGSMVRSYGKKTAGMNQEMKEKALDEARRYNEELLSSSQTVDKVPVFAGTFTMSTVFLV